MLLGGTLQLTQRPWYVKFRFGRAMVKLKSPPRGKSVLFFIGGIVPLVRLQFPLLVRRTYSYKIRVGRWWINHEPCPKEAINSFHTQHWNSSHIHVVIEKYWSLSSIYSILYYSTNYSIHTILFYKLFYLYCALPQYLWPKGIEVIPSSNRNLLSSYGDMASFLTARVLILWSKDEEISWLCQEKVL